MAKIFISVMCLLTLSLLSQNDRYQDYRIIGDNVNVRSDTGLSSKVIAKANFGEEFNCHRVDSSWHECQTCFNGDYPCYISSKYLANDDEFILLCEKKNRKDLSTLLILESLYSYKGDYDKTIATSIEITEQYRKSTKPSKDLICALYRGLSVYLVVPSSQNRIKYKTSILSDYCTKIINESQDSMLICWALVTKCECYVENGEPKLAKEILLKAIKNYGKFLLEPRSCNYGRYKRTSFMRISDNGEYFADNTNSDTYKLHFEFINELKKICNDPNANVASKAIACNLLLKQVL